MNKQQIFDDTYNHYYVLQNPFGFSDGNCVYGDPDNPDVPKCAIGRYMPEDWSEMRSQHSITDLLDNADVMSVFEDVLDDSDGEQFLIALQEAHDWGAEGGENGLGEFRGRMMELAQNFELEFKYS